MNTKIVLAAAFSAEYDSTKSVTLEATVTKMEWANPHISCKESNRDIPHLVRRNPRRP